MSEQCFLCGSEDVLAKPCEGCEGEGDVDFEECHDCEGTGDSSTSFICASCNREFSL